MPGPKGARTRQFNFYNIRYERGIAMHIYKTSEKMRRVALAYYYTNRSAILEARAVERRAAGVPKLRARTSEERLARVIMCATCGRQVTTPSILKAGCRQCLRCRRRVRTTHEQRRQTARQWRNTIRQRYRTLKTGLCCAVCKETSNLDFHHRDPTTKAAKVSRLASQGRSWSKLLREIEKCDVLCTACHREIHSTGR